jgi:hypothetical protein
MPQAREGADDAQRIRREQLAHFGDAAQPKATTSARMAASRIYRSFSGPTITS